MNRFQRASRAQPDRVFESRSRDGRRPDHGDVERGFRPGHRELNNGSQISALDGGQPFGGEGIEHLSGRPRATAGTAGKKSSGYASASIAEPGARAEVYRCSEDLSRNACAHPLPGNHSGRIRRTLRPLAPEPSSATSIAGRTNRCRWRRVVCASRSATQQRHIGVDEGRHHYPAGGIDLPRAAGAGQVLHAARWSDVLDFPVADQQRARSERCSTRSWRTRGGVRSARAASTVAGRFGPASIGRWTRAPNWDARGPILPHYSSCIIFFRPRTFCFSSSVASVICAVS